MVDENHSCPIEKVAKLIGDKWTLLILRDLGDGCKRFGELQKSVTGISPRTLSTRLRMLEQNGVMTRRVFAEIPPRVEYTLTEKGAALLPLIESMRAYGNEWLMDAATAA